METMQLSKEAAIQMTNGNATAIGALCADGVRRTVRLTNGTPTGKTWPGRASIGGKTVRGYVRTPDLCAIQKGTDLQFVAIGADGKAESPKAQLADTKTVEVKSTKTGKPATVAVNLPAPANAVGKGPTPKADNSPSLVDHAMASMVAPVRGKAAPVEPKTNGKTKPARAKASDPAERPATAPAVSGPTETPATGETPAPVQATPKAGKAKGATKAKTPKTPAKPKAPKTVERLSDGTEVFPGIVVQVSAASMAEKNAFLLVGKVSKAMRDEDKVSIEEVAKFQKEATAAYYKAILATCAKWVNLFKVSDAVVPAAKEDKPTKADKPAKVAKTAKVSK